MKKIKALFHHCNVQNEFSLFEVFNFQAGDTCGVCLAKEIAEPTI